MKVRTTLCHTGRGDQTQEVRSVNAPVMRASTILFQNYETWQKYRDLRKKERVLSYGARGTATNFELEKLVCELEGGYRAQLFPTGLASLAMVLLNYAKAGTHYIISDAIYGPVRTVAEEFLKKVDVEVSYCKADCSNLEELIKPNTTLLLCESPGSILYEIVDLPKVSKIAHDHGMIVAIDNTWASGFLFQPLKHGADISVIAATKYLSGHSDVTMGIVVCNEKTWPSFSVLPEALGFTTSPDDAYLVMRGIRTLPVRLRQHEKTNDQVVEYLKTRPEIKTIFYPKLETHPGHDVFMKLYDGANGMLTIELADGYTKEDAVKFQDALKYFACGASWGGYESLATVTTPPRTATDWSKRGPFVRFHIGLEDAEDLIEDLGQALDLISKEKK
ncbi:MAG: cystathionine beta-lyase [Burkholderiales bacterium]|nr:cystathionine beta-lyase [Burkholderiales bacterium]